MHTVTVHGELGRPSGVIIGDDNHPAFNAPDENLVQISRALRLIHAEMMATNGLGGDPFIAGVAKGLPLPLPSSAGSRRAHHATAIARVLQGFSVVPRVRDLLSPPSRDTDPREALAWVRRVELLSGAVVLLIGISLWAGGWWDWVLIGLGVLMLSPWPGVRSVLRRAETRPELLTHDRERGRARARRFAVVWVPVFVLAASAIGYAYGHWLGAALNFVLVGLGAGLGAWWMFRRL